MKTNTYITILIATAVIFTASLAISSEMSLYERIGGEKKARAIVSDIWDNHSKNPIVKDRFAKSNPDYVKQRVFEIFAAATGATDVTYGGLDMKTAHTGMNISEMEFNAVVDDVLAACESNGVAQQEMNEVLAILWSVRKDIVNSHIITDTLVSSDSSSKSHHHKKQTTSNNNKHDAHYCLKSHEC
ncbi:MAG: group 1 truncated hemoglobin [Gammaproteobacteria bacterium]|nr:group 1 truncated hemoglobin [Gammaproteobacteria bacterium]